MIDTKKYLQELIKKAAPEAEKDEITLMSQELEPVLYEWILEAIAVQLKNKDQETFFDLLEKEGISDKTSHFLKSKITNFPQFLQKTYDNFADYYLKQFKNFEDEFGNELEDEEED